MMFDVFCCAAQALGASVADVALTAAAAARAAEGPRCVCMNGVGAVGSACPEKWAEQCASCDPGYVLLGFGCQRGGVL